MELVVQAFEVAGVAILAVGSLTALIGARWSWPRGAQSAYERARQDVGRAVLLGLEVLIIADIVQTITIDPTLESAVTLALIVVVRTFLSFSLEIELEGVVRGCSGTPMTERAVTDPHHGAPMCGNAMMTGGISACSQVLFDPPGVKHARPLPCCLARSRRCRSSANCSRFEVADRTAVAPEPGVHPTSARGCDQGFRGR